MITEFGSNPLSEGFCRRTSRKPVSVACPENIMSGFPCNGPRRYFMNKSEFIRAYADSLGVTIKDAETYFNAFLETITDSLKKGEYVHISGFATFDLRDKNERDGVNPLTGEKVVIPACKSPVVKFSKSYKELFNR